MKTKTRIWLAGVAALAWAMGAAGADATYRLTPSERIPLWAGTGGSAPEWQAKNAAAAEVLVGGHPEAKKGEYVSKNVLGGDACRFNMASIGGIFSVEKDDFTVGDYCTYFPADESQIDWEATRDAIKASAGNRDGYVYFMDGATNELERVLFARKGTCTVPWKLKDGSTLEQAYTVGLNVSERPHRLFWTSAPFNCPAVTTKGKHLRFLGHPDIVRPMVAVDDKSGVESVVRGLKYDSGNGMVTAVCQARQDANGNELEPDGPEGQIVVVYYDSGLYDRPLGRIVVQVSRPDPVYKTVKVGEALRPTGGGFDIAGLAPAIMNGNVGVDNDARSPYVYYHRPEDKAHPKYGNVYAISPTDPRATGSAKVSIVWQAPDAMDTLWPFEQVCYTIEWPDDMPKMVVGDADGARGPGMLTPDGYSAEVCEYSEPKGLAKATTNRVTATEGGGKFTLKLSTQDGGVWFVPFETISRSDARFDLEPFPWFVGEEVQARGWGKTAYVQETARRIDADFPGYVHQPVQNKLINPNLYHEPGPDQLKSGGEKTWDEDTDKMLQLGSAIYFVNTEGPGEECENPLEVWWYEKVQKDDMPEALAMPALPQVYKPAWPQEQDVQTIVMASQKGSKAESRMATAGALYLAGVDAGGETGAIKPDEGENLVVSFWINPGPAAAYGATTTAGGRVLTLKAVKGEGETVEKALLVDYTSWEKKLWLKRAEKTDTTGTSSISSSLMMKLDVAQNDWTWVRLEFVTGEGGGMVLRAATLTEMPEDPSRAALMEAIKGKVKEKQVDIDPGEFTLSVGKDGRFGGDSAKGVALDEISVATTTRYNLDDESEHNWEMREIYKLTFDLAGDLALERNTSMRHAREEATRSPVEFGGVLALSPGAPAMGRTAIPWSEEVPPRVYVQNDREKAGYNPNEEHALLLWEGGEWAAYALRCDLNQTEGGGDGGFSSRPYVLVECDDGGKGAMRIFGVAVTNDRYRALAGNVIAGTMISGPHPFDKLDGFYNDENWTEQLPRIVDGEEVMVEDGNPAYVDRKKRLWARRDGAFSQYFYYPVQEGFAFPAANADMAKWPKSGELVPWMNAAENAKMRAEPMNGTPLPWRWDCEWPSEDGVPSMDVGQTLTKAVNGLPEVWGANSIGVAYPSVANGTNVREVVRLIDPTVAQTAGLPIEKDFPTDYGFTLGDSGTVTLRSGKYYVAGLPPTISDRFYIDTTRPEDSNMVLIGQMAGKVGGVEYLQLNVLSEHEREALKAACKTENGEKLQKWRDAVDALATGAVTPTVQKCVGRGTDSEETKKLGAVRNEYSPKDRYALVASGDGSGWVTIIENDGPTENGMVGEGDPISMHVIRVSTNLYTAPLVALEDPNNKLSEKLDILYTAPFGEAAGNYEFEWRKTAPPDDGAVPSNYGEWGVSHSGDGLTEIHLGAAAASLKELSNTYYALRYRAKAGTKAAETTGGLWSGWCGPTLAEGWVQRVLNTITPFAQRLDDFYSNPAEVALTMPEQIGAPYRGDVALNMGNLNDVGLLELYHTVLNKAESMSLTNDDTDLSANKQLLMAVSRLADLYILLGGEAYSDAKNPTIAEGVENGDATGAASGTAFCFRNQVATLLDEELCLLRGRPCGIAPSTTTYPYYNRLMWNFTKGITEGEVAYVNNYRIIGNEGKITAECAAAQYPQGHGDAYGHYLSAVKLYYRLLRNPSYWWGDPAMTEMLVNDAVANMDYEDEQKFATAAAKLAQTALDALDLTARKQWKEANGEITGGYFDGAKAKPNANSGIELEQGFGYGEWAARSGLGAFYNWAVGNALLPADEKDGVYRFTGETIKNITRERATSLEYLADAVKEIEGRLNRLDSGMNPLGLSDNAVQFDLNPLALEYGGKYHFDQVCERAERALANAEATLAHANRYGNRLAKINEISGDMAVEFEEMEEGYKRDLIAIFGTPYADDIGPSGTYPQGYDGPDIYHYTWMNLDEFGFSEVDMNVTTSIVGYAGMSRLPYTYGDFDMKESGTIRVQLDITKGGLVKKPDSVKGTRLTEGTVQTAYREFLAAYNEVLNAQAVYSHAVSLLEKKAGMLKSRFAREQTKLTMEEALNAAKAVFNYTRYATDAAELAVNTAQETTEMSAELAEDSTPGIQGAGMTVNLDLRSMTMAVTGAIMLGPKVAAKAQDTAGKLLKAQLDLSEKELDLAVKEIELGLNYMEKQEGMYNEFCAQATATRSAARELKAALAAWNTAEEAYKREVERGNMLMSEREMVRRHQSEAATPLRYADMHYRVQRNDALSKYATAFDTAQRYVYMLAKAYDYETGLLSRDPLAGDRFYSEIIGTRTLGNKGVAVVANGGDGGLWDAVHRMKENMEALKGRLGMHDATRVAKWFSLRYSLFRIAPDASGDAAWEKELEKYWVDDIREHPDFKRHCQPPLAAGAGAAREPGLVIPFGTSVNAAENFFGKTLAGGETAFSSADYATKILRAGVRFDGYNEPANGWGGTPALATSPNVYLVPVGRDMMRAPGGGADSVLAYRVEEQVMPLPYAVGSAELDDPDWLATGRGLDGTSDSFAALRRHGTLPEGGGLEYSRLTSRSVWNDRWILVIPGSSLLGDREKGLRTFIHGADLDGDGVADQKPVRDICIGIEAFARQGN